jgi:lipopolysaccharide transport system ATP-binding protein
LDDVSFEVEKGSVVGVIGRNGAGKSTLLKVLTRITAPTKGRIELSGRVGSLLEVGTGFHPELTGRENVYLNGTLLGMKKKEIQRRFDDIVEFAGVEQFLDTQVKRYSTGMYVRLAFGVAAHLESEILVVDEVLAVGDADFQAKCLKKMREVAQQGRTVFLVSHQVQTITSLATSALYLEKGRLLYEGDLSGALEEYKRSFERSAVASSDSSLRPGNGDVRFNSVSSNQEIFEAAEEKIAYFSATALPSATGKYYVTCTISDANRFVVAHCDSRFSDFWISPGATVEGAFKIKSPWMKPGEYTIDMAIHGVRLADEWEGSMSFKVLPIFPYPAVAPADATSKGTVLADFEVVSV